MNYIKICLLFLIIILSYSCVNEKKVTIIKKIIEYVPKEGTDEAQPVTIPKEHIVKETLPIDTEQLFLGVPIRTSIEEIKGVEQLTNLKYLFLGYGVKDNYFLKKLKNLEILVLDHRYEGNDDLLYLNNFINLSILYLNSVYMKKPVIDLKYNNNLKFLYLRGLFVKSRDYFELEIKNIPESLEYLDLSDSIDVIINNKLLDLLKDIPHVIVYNQNRYSKFEITEEELKSYPNVHVGLSKDFLPEKYQKKQIYGLFDIPENW